MNHSRIANPKQANDTSLVGMDMISIVLCLLKISTSSASLMSIGCVYCQDGNFGASKITGCAPVYQPGRRWSGCSSESAPRSMVCRWVHRYWLCVCTTCVVVLEGGREGGGRIEHISWSPVHMPIIQWGWTAVVWKALVKRSKLGEVH